MYFEIGDFNALRTALHELADALSREKLSEETVFGCKLVASELLSNVLQHGGGRAIFLAERRGGEIRLCVKGENGYCPPEQSACADVLSENGRGLFLVDSFCERRDYTLEEGIRVFMKAKFL